MFEQLPHTVQDKITQLLRENQFALAKKMYEQNVDRRRREKDSDPQEDPHDMIIEQDDPPNTQIARHEIFSTLHRVMLMREDNGLDERYNVFIKIFFICVYCFFSNS